MMAATLSFSRANSLPLMLFLDFCRTAENKMVNRIIGVVQKGIAYCFGGFFQILCARLLSLVATSHLD